MSSMTNLACCDDAWEDFSAPYEGSRRFVYCCECGDVNGQRGEVGCDVLGAMFSGLAVERCTDLFV